MIFLKYSLLLFFYFAADLAFAQVQLRYEGYIENGGVPVVSSNQSFIVRIRKPGCASNLSLPDYSSGAVISINSGEFNLAPTFDEGLFAAAMDPLTDWGGGPCAPGPQREMQIVWSDQATTFTVALQDAPRAIISKIAQSAQSLGSRNQDQFLKIDSYATQTPLTNAQVNSLLQLVNGTATSYLKSSDSTSGDLAGTYGAPVVDGLQTVPVASTAPSLNQVLKYNGTSWAPAPDDAGVAPGDASYAAKGLVQLQTDLATSGIEINAGVIKLPNIIAGGGPIGSANTIPVISYDAKGRLTTVTTAVVNDDTKLSLAGGTMTGALNMGSQNIANVNAVSATSVGTRAVNIYDADNSNLVQLQSQPVLAANYTLTLPGNDGNAGEVLSTDGNGILSWVAASGGSVTAITSMNSYLTVAGTASVPTLTVNVGTVANTVAAGDDARIVNAIQAADYAGDVADSASCTDGQVPYWNTISDKWLCRSIGAVASATTAVNFTGSLAGDVTGPQSATMVEKIRGVNVVATPPTSGQVLKFDGTNYVPSSDAGIITELDPSVQIWAKSAPDAVFNTGGGQLNITKRIPSAAALPNATENGKTLRWNNTLGEWEWFMPGGGGGISSLNGQTGTSQSFLTGASGNSPAFSSAGDVHMLNIPLASSSVLVTSGTISNADYLNFSNKLSSPLTAKGDLLTRDATNHMRLPVGSNGQILKANSAMPSGLEWGNIDLSQAGIGVLTSNTHLGQDAGSSITGGANNSFFGFSAGLNLSTGNRNISFGSESGMSLTSGSDNTLLGYRAGRNLTTENGNLFIGSKAGDQLTIGNNNVIIGSNDGFSVSGDDNIILSNGSGIAQLSINQIGEAVLAGPLKLGLGSSASCSPALTGYIRLNSLSYNIEKCDGASWVSLGGGSFVAPLQSTYVTPSYNFQGAPASGLYMDNASQDVGLTTAGVERLRVQNSNGYVAIMGGFSPSPPAAPLHVNPGTVGSGSLAAQFEGTVFIRQNINNVTANNPALTIANANGIAGTKSILEFQTQDGATSKAGARLIAGKGISGGNFTIQVPLNAAGNYVDALHISDTQNVTLSRTLDFKSITGATQSAAGEGRIYFDSTQNKFKVSENGSAFVDLVGAGGAAPMGTVGDIQFNNGGSFGANSNLFWDNTNLRLGIGTNAPQRHLHVNGPMRIAPTSLSGGAAGDLAIDSTDGNKLKFHDGSSWKSTSGVPAAMTSPTSPGYSFQGNSSTGLYSNVANSLGFAVAGSPALYINPSANVGIGTTAPQRKLHLNGSMRMDPTTTPTVPTAGDMFFDVTDGNKLKFYDGAAWVIAGGGGGGDIFNNGNTSGAPVTIGTNDSFALNLETNGTNRVSVSNSGLVGIGTTAPNGNLHIYEGQVSTPAVLRMGNLMTGAASTDGLEFYVDSTTSSAYISNREMASLSFGSGGVYNDILIDSVGNVGIGGISNPTFNLDVFGSAYIGDTASFLQISNTFNRFITNNAAMPMQFWTNGTASPIDIRTQSDNSNIELTATGVGSKVIIEGNAGTEIRKATVSPNVFVFNPAAGGTLTVNPGAATFIKVVGFSSIMSISKVVGCGTTFGDGTKITLMLVSYNGAAIQVQDVGVTDPNTDVISLGSTLSWNATTAIGSSLTLMCLVGVGGNKWIEVSRTNIN